MTQQKYSMQSYNKDNMARVLGRSLPISTKQSVEICSFLRGKNLQKAKEIMSRVIEKKEAVPYKRYNRSIGHKPGKMAVGRYPVKASKEILAVLESVEANAQVKGLNTSNLTVVHISAQKATNQLHHGRQRGRQMKRTHIEVVVEEGAETKKSKTSNKKAKENKEEVKAAEKTEVKEESKKVEEVKKEDKSEEQPKGEVKETKAEKKEVKKEDKEVQKESESKQEKKETPNQEAKK